MDAGAPSPTTARRPALVAAVLLVAAVAVAVAVAVAAGGGDRAGGPDEAPSFALPDLRRPDRTIRLSDFEGRPLVVNFWASWCVPCRKEMPAFEALHQRLSDRVAVLGIDRLDQRDDALAFLDEVGATYPAAYDRDATLDAPFRLVAMPTTVFVSPDGEVLERIAGELSAERLDEAVRRHFGDVLGPQS